MNKKGVTLIELLAALVIMGIVASLVGLLLSSFQNANSTINEEGKANIESTLLIAEIHNELNDFNPTNYRECVSTNCIILEKHFAYDYSNENTSIILETYDPPLEYSLEFIGEDLFLNGVVYELEYFTFGNDFSISAVTSTNDKVIISIDFSLVSEMNTYEFSMSHSFDIETLPV